MIGVHLPPPREPVASAIVRRAIDGDLFAEEQLIEHFAPGLLAHLTRRLRDREAAREVADDVLMAMVRAVREDRLRHPERVAGFVYATARNLANNYLRVLHGRPQPEPLGADVAAEDPAEGLERGEQLARLREGLETLRDLERQILLLTLEGLKPATIASRLGLSCDVVRARKSRAMRKLTDSVGFRSHGPPPRVPARSCALDIADRHEKRRRPWRIR
ncbi:MAG TPA: sigma-70 family RNA polymerase sigma factor [Vicinamibacteria bacterium]|nr:sigma-70 family RNA polymerase sigma factor [Vicinamibacteria bacterium]